MLLTGKNPELLRNYDGSWNWQDECFISEQLANILVKAIAIYPQYLYIHRRKCSYNGTF